MLTNFIETEALLLALEDTEVDSGIYTVDEYLRKNFLLSELKTLEHAAELLADRCFVIRTEKS